MVKFENLPGGNPHTFERYIEKERLLFKNNLSFKLDNV